MTIEMFISSGINFLQQKFYGNRPIESIKPLSIAPSQFATKDECNQEISRKLIADAPVMISRFGSVEMMAFSNWLDRNDKRNIFTKTISIIRGETGPFWHSEKNRRSMDTPAGFFPATFNMIDRFAELVSHDCSLIDIHASWYPGEYRLKQKFYPLAKTCTMGQLSPFGSTTPWTKSLRGKKVLIINPFSETIKRQYAHRQDLFDDPDFMPDLELITYKSVVSHCGEQTPYPNWFSALQHMIDDIAKIDFDIAIIGAGAYGMSLAAAIKRMGKKAVHLGGETQLLFGIIGNRWERNPGSRKLFKSTWCHPSPDETPKNAAKCENGSYW